MAYDEKYPEKYSWNWGKDSNVNEMLHVRFGLPVLYGSVDAVLRIGAG